MDRQQKINLLQDIKEGKATIDSLMETSYIFLKSAGPEPTYSCDGKIYSEEEYNKKCNQIKTAIITLPDNGRGRN